MKKALAAAGIGAALLTIPLAAAGTASAGTEKFLSEVQEDIPFVVQQYGGPAVLSMGTQICQWAAQGVTGASEVADRVIAQMPMSRTAAIHLKVDAQFYLGC